MKKILTTVGTSLLTHLREEKWIDKGEYDYFHNNEKDADKIYNDRKDKEKIDRLKKIALRYLSDKDINNNEDLNKMSAELKSLYKIIKSEKLDRPDIYFIYSDTPAGKVVTDILKEYLNKSNKLNAGSIEMKKISYLQVFNRMAFENEGIPNLIEYVSEKVNFDYKTGTEYSKNIILNITGGFKAVVPYLTLMGSVFEIPVYYIFEETDELIKLPPMPVRFNYKILEDNLEIINKIAKEKIMDRKTFYELTSNMSTKDRKKLETDYMKVIDDLYEFHPIAYILWSKVKQKYLFNIYLSKSAREFYENNKNKAPELLISLANPQLRRAHFDPLENTDLNCHKRQKGLQGRVIYIEGDEKIKVAEIFHGHDNKYERFLKNPRQSRDYTYEHFIIKIT
jgi:putative CRISPR-associated protein (TIGR02619 family)